MLPSGQNFSQTLKGLQSTSNFVNHAEFNNKNQVSGNFRFFKCFKIFCFKKQRNCNIILARCAFAKPKKPFALLKV